MPAADVPTAWASRAVPMALVSLVPAEAAELLGRARPRLEGQEEALARLLVQGASGAEISRELGIPLRTVQRRIARLRRRFEATSTTELVGLLARSGVG